MDQEWSHPIKSSHFMKTATPPPYNSQKFWRDHRYEVMRLITETVQNGQLMRIVVNEGIPAQLICNEAGISSSEMNDTMALYDQFSNRFGSNLVESSRGMVVFDQTVLAEFMRLPEAARIVSEMTSLSVDELTDILSATGL